MKLNSIINRYIFREMIPPFLLSLGFFTFVFLLTQIMDITKLVVNYKVGLSSVLLLIAYTIPYFLQYTIPLSVMMSVLLTFLRLSSDNEIIALKAGGVGLYRLLPPVLFFCLILYLLTGFMAIRGMPWGETSFKDLSMKIAMANVDIGLKERTFNDSFKGVMLYVNRIDRKSRELRDIFIEDQRKGKIRSTVIAPRGVLDADPVKMRYTLRLYDGMMNQVGLEKRTVNTLRFDTHDITLDVEQAVSDAQKRSKGKNELSLSEMRAYLRNDTVKNKTYHKIEIRYHQKFSIPFACFTLGLLAVPLGLKGGSSRRSSGLMLSLAFFLFYFLLLALASSLGESGTLPPAIGMWVPNVVMGSAGLRMLIGAANERPMNFFFLTFKIRKLLARFT